LDTNRRSRGRKKLIPTSLSCTEKDDGFCGSGDESIQGGGVKKISQKKAEIQSHNDSDQHQQRRDDLLLDLEMMPAREQDERAERKRRNNDNINNCDDFIPRLISQMKKAADVNFFIALFLKIGSFNHFLSL